MRGAIKARVSTGVHARGIPSSGRMAAVRAERGSIMVMSAVMIPVFLLLTALVDGRRQLVHAQAPAAEPRRRGRARRRRRVREELEGLRPDRRPAASRVDRRVEIADAAQRVRGRPRGVRLRRRRSCRRRCGTPRSRTRRTSTSSSTRATRTTRTTPTTRTAAARPRWATRAPFTRPVTTSPRAGHWTDVRVKERDLPSLFGTIGLPLVAERRAGPGRGPPGDQRPRGSCRSRCRTT